MMQISTPQMAPTDLMFIFLFVLILSIIVLRKLVLAKIMDIIFYMIYYNILVMLYPSTNLLDLILITVTSFLLAIMTRKLLWRLKK